MSDNDGTYMVEEQLCNLKGKIFIYTVDSKLYSILRVNCHSLIKDSLVYLSNSDNDTVKCKYELFIKDFKFIPFMFKIWGIDGKIDHNLVNEYKNFIIYITTMLDVEYLSKNFFDNFDRYVLMYAGWIARSEHVPKCHLCGKALTLEEKVFYSTENNVAHCDSCEGEMYRFEQGENDE